MIKLISKYLKGSARVCAFVAPLMMLVEVFMDLQQPTIMSNIIDIGVANNDITYVLNTGIKMIIFTIIGFIGGASCSIFASIASVNMSGKMRQGLFDKIQSLSFVEIDHFKTSSLITRLTNDVMQIQSMMIMMLRVMVRSPIICVGSIIMSFFLSPKLSLLFCFVLPIIICGIIIVLKKAQPLFMQVQKQLDKVNTVMRENLLGVRVIKSFTMEGKQNERFCAVNDELTNKSIHAQNITFLLMPVVTLTMNLSVVAILWFGGRMVISNSIEIGKIMAFINYLVQITHSLMNAVNLVINISRAQASSARINEVLAVESSIKEPENPISPNNYDIEFKNVSFRYGKSEAAVLKNLSFTIKEGETVGIIGATGSGKSSLVNLIPRLYDPIEGQVFIGNIDIRCISLAELNRKIGVIMQDNILFSGTIGSNLRFGNNLATDEELYNACADAQVIDFINSLPQAFDNTVEQRGKNFSGGQKQRLSIARTLLKNLKILILDDSMSAVDLKTEAYLRTNLINRMNGCTLIVIAQRISAVMDADKIFVLIYFQICKSCQ